MLHIPVLMNTMLKYLSPHDGQIYIDATFGAGGYTKAILDNSNCKVIAFDCDQEVKNITDQFKHIYKERFEFYPYNNSLMLNMLQNLTSQIDGIVYDLGVSSMQIDIAERGFSFQKNGPLDMRMDKNNPFSAYDVVNSYSQEDLANIIYFYGDERKAKQIAKAIVQHRNITPIETTTELSNIIKKCVKYYKDSIDPATRTFQAIRIEVNDELRSIKSSLQAAKTLLKIEGRMVVVSFHSGEDKIVKSLFNEWCGKVANPNRYMPPILSPLITPTFEFLHKGVMLPSMEELKANPRARSAKLRAIKKIA